MTSISEAKRGDLTVRARPNETIEERLTSLEERVAEHLRIYDSKVAYLANVEEATARRLDEIERQLGI